MVISCLIFSILLKVCLTGGGVFWRFNIKDSKSTFISLYLFESFFTFLSNSGILSILQDIKQVFCGSC